MPDNPPVCHDGLNGAIRLLVVALTLTILPIALITTDHLLRQKPGLERQAAVFAALGRDTPCLFPAAHPLRIRFTNTGAIDWRPSPTLPPAAPGPTDLIRSTAPTGETSGHVF